MVSIKSKVHSEKQELQHLTDKANSSAERASFHSFVVSCFAHLVG